MLFALLRRLCCCGEEEGNVCCCGGECLDDPAQLAACASWGGTLVNGPWQDCVEFAAQGQSCPAPNDEACCTPALDCLETDPCQCRRTGNAPQGSGTTCDPNPCLDLWVCCCTNGACHDVITVPGGFPECDDFCGEGLVEAAIPGVTCASNPCPQQQACCLPDGSCQDVQPSVCAALGGVSMGAGTDCATTMCPQPDQACCFPDGSCQNLSPDICLPSGGVPQGFGTNCATTDCPEGNGACCAPSGQCSVTTPEMCAGMGHTFLGFGVDCGPPNPCPQPPAQGGCCHKDDDGFNTGQCSVGTAAACAGMTNPGQYLGDGSDCSGDPCPFCDECGPTHIDPLPNEYGVEWGGFCIGPIQDSSPTVCDHYCATGVVEMVRTGPTSNTWIHDPTASGGLPPEVICSTPVGQENCSLGSFGDGYEVQAQLRCLASAPAFAPPAMVGEPVWELVFQLSSMEDATLNECSACQEKWGAIFYRLITEACEDPTGGGYLPNKVEEICGSVANINCPCPNPLAPDECCTPPTILRVIG